MLYLPPRLDSLLLVGFPLVLRVEAQPTEPLSKFVELSEGGRILSSRTLRLIGILFLVVSAVLAVLNLKMVADLGTLWISTPLMIIGIALIAMARKRK